MDINELKERFDALSRKRDSFLTTKAILESQVKANKEAYDEVVEQLKEKYGVENLDEARATYSKKVAELEQAINKAEINLKEGDVGA